MSASLRLCGRLGFALVLSVLPVRATLTVSFDDLPLEPGRDYWNGADGSGGIFTKGLQFANSYVRGESGDYWSGFAYSRVNDTNTSGYLNQYAVYSGAGVSGTGQYAVAYDDGAGSAVVTLPYATEVAGFWANNTTYAALDMLRGSAWSKQFGGVSGDDPDWFLLTVEARDAAGAPLGSNACYLADYRFETNSEDDIVSEWTWVSLTNLGGSVKSLHFTLSSSDTFAGWMNTPAYFALDGLRFRGVFSLAAGDGDNPHDPGVPAFVGPAGDGRVATNNHANPLFFAWATACTDYRPAPGVDVTWTNVAKALGSATGDSFDIVALGDLNAAQIATGHPPGEITLTFAEPLRDRPGADFAVFENGFGLGAALFAEFAYVEVSSDGTNFARFPSVMLDGEPVGGYGTVNPARVYNLAGKHRNNSNSGDAGGSWGTPFDLADLTLDALVREGNLSLTNVQYVKLVDVPGRGDFTDSLGQPIYDSWVTTNSGGFDLEAVGLLKPVVSIAAAPPRLLENTSREGTILVSRDAYFRSQPLTVRLQIGGTASNGTDYAAVTDVVHFARGTTNAEVRVRPLNDGTPEGDETVAAAIAPDDAYTVLGTGEATVVITDVVYPDSAWVRLPLPDRSDSAVNFGTALAHLPDGRCAFGERGNLYLQESWEGSNWLPFAREPAQNDPSFVAVWDEHTGALGAGGWSGSSALYAFAPSDTNSEFAAFTTNFNFAAVFRDVSTLYVAGGDYGESNVRLVSLDGQTNRVVVETVATFGAGIALDNEGGLYLGDADDGRVYRFSREQLDAALTNAALTVADGERICQFVQDGTTNALGSIAVDGRGCVWAAGWNVPGLQMYDPDTGERARYVPALSNGNYTVAGFTRAGRRYIAYVNLAGYGAGAAQSYGYLLADGEDEIGLRVTEEQAHELGFAPGAFRLTRRSWRLDGDVHVPAQFGGTASNGTDYVALAGPVSLPSGRRSAAVSVQPLADTEAEGAESVILRLGTNGSHVVWGSPSGTVWIADLPVDAWRAAHFGALANAPAGADDGDWDGDGAANLLEYTLNRAPTNFNAQSALDPLLATTNGGAWRFRVVYERRKDLPDAVVHAEASPGLRDAAWGTTAVVERVAADHGESETVEATLGEDWGSGFMRLRAARK